MQAEAEHEAYRYDDNDDDDDAEEEDECRVCRGPAEQGRPLFKPCICSGSIGLTHQDCLQSWLQVQRGDGSCELCKTKFRFAPKYAVNAPAKLPLPQVIAALCRRAVAKWLPFTLRSLFAASLWLLFAPLLTAYLYHAWMARPTVILERMGERDMIVTDLVSGGVVAACIIVSFLSLMSFADFLRVEWQQRQRGAHRHQHQHHHPPQQNQNQQQRNNNNVDQNNPNPGAIADVFAAAAAVVAAEDLDVDNGVWDHVQQQVLQQPTKIALNPRLRHLAARERGMREHGDNSLDEEQEQSDDHDDDELGSTDDFYDDDDDDDCSDQEHEETANSEDEVLELDAGVDDNDEEEDDDDDDSEEDESWQSEDDNDDLEDDEYVSSSDDENDHDDEDDDSDHEDAAMPPLLPGNGVAEALLNIPHDEILQQLARQRQIQRDEARIDQPFDLMDQDEPIDMDINIALDELLGVRGPLLGVGRNLLWLLAFNAVYLGFFAFVPRTIGMAVSSILFNTTAFATASVPAADDSNATEARFHFNASEDSSLVSVWKAIEAESIQQKTTFRLHDIATVSLGYLSLAIAVVCVRLLWSFSQKVRLLRSAHGRTGNHPDDDEMRDAFDEINRVVHGLGDIDGPHFGDDPHGVAVSVALVVALDAMVAIVKVGVLLFLKMFLLPIVLGIALDASTMPLFGSTLEERIAYAGRDIFSFILLHWVAGITFMLFVTVSVLQLREVAHPDLLAQMIRPQEPQPDLLGNLMHESVSTHSKRMFLSLIIYAFLLTLHIYVPVRFGISSLIGERFKSQLQLKFFYILPPQLQVPLELLFFHLCMLALLEKYKNGLGGMQHNWLKFMSKIMGLSDNILPQHVGKFRLLGSRPVFQRGRKVDPFWYDLSSGSKDVLAVLQSNLGSFEPAAANVLCACETKPNGERVLRSGADYIRLPIRLPGKALRSRSILLPTKIGKYRLKRDTCHNINPAIQLWEEVSGEPISRPPEGWDDLGAGGADVQGRWAWGSEKKSSIEGGVAARRPFFHKEQGLFASLVVCLKLLALGMLSWLAVSIILCIVAAVPLAIGRSLYCILRIPDRWIHDPLAFGLGFMITFPLARKATRAIMSSEIPLYQRLQHWLGRFHAPPAYKALVLLNTAIFWLVLAPLLLGLSYDLAFIKSCEWFAEKEPLLDRNTIILSWMGGTVLLYVWADLCILGVLTKNYRVFLFEGREVPANENRDAADWQDADGGGRHLAWQGKHGRVARFWGVWKSVVRSWEWDQVDEVLLLHECAAPIVVALFWALFLPLTALGICAWRFPLLSGLTRAIFVRSVLAMTCCIQVGRVWKDQLRRFFDAAHKTARDDRYLIGEILMNHGESETISSAEI